MLPANKNLPAFNPEHPLSWHLVWSQNNRAPATSLAGTSGLSSTSVIPEEWMQTLSLLCWKKWKMYLPSDRMSNADPWHSAGQAKHHFDFPGNRGSTVLMYLRWGKDTYRPEKVLGLLFDSISHSYPPGCISWCRNTWHETDAATESWEQNQSIFSRGDPWALLSPEAGRPGAFGRFTSARSEGGLTLGSSEMPPGQSPNLMLSP